MRRNDMDRRWAVGLSLAGAAVTAACATGATPGPVSHSPFDLPTQKGTSGVYLRDCLSPGSGLALGSEAPRVFDRSRVTAVVRCEPVPARDAVEVSTATGDIGPLLSAFAQRTASPTTTGKAAVFIVYLDDRTMVVLTAPGIPDDAVARANFTVVGTTPPGSL